MLLNKFVILFSRQDSKSVTLHARWNAHHLSTKATCDLAQNRRFYPRACFEKAEKGNTLRATWLHTLNLMDALKEWILRDVLSRRYGTIGHTSRSRQLDCLTCLTYARSISRSSGLSSRVKVYYLSKNACLWEITQKKKWNLIAGRST